MLHLVYKITNKINGHYYIGVHSTIDIEDGYMGSGTLMKKALRKYGAESFQREILFVFENRQDAFQKELELVNLNTLNDPNCYNLVYGGAGPKTKPFYSIKAEQITTYPKSAPPFDRSYEYKVGLLYPVKLDEEGLTSFGKAFWRIIISEQLLNTISELYNRVDGNKLANMYISLLERVPAFKYNIAIYRYPKTTLV